METEWSSGKQWGMVYWVFKLALHSFHRPSNFNLNCRASKEYSSCKRHKIIPNGYNIGRDWLVDRAVEGGRWKGMRWKAEVEWRSDLIESGQKRQLFFPFPSLPTSQPQTQISRGQSWHPPRWTYCDSHRLPAMIVLPFVLFPVSGFSTRMASTRNTLKAIFDPLYYSPYVFSLFTIMYDPA